MNFCKTLAVLAVLLALHVDQAHTQETPDSGPISTERPGLGASPDVVPAHSLQVENGANVSLQRHSYVADLPENLIRVGVSDRLELRFQNTDVMLQNGARHTSTADTQISGKLLTGKPNQLVPRSAIVALGLPTGGRGFTSGSWDPSLTAVWAQSFRRGYFLSEDAQVALTTLGHARRPIWAPSIAGGRSLSSNLAVFAEYAPSVLTNGSYTYTVDGGASLTLHNNRQIDVRTGYTADCNGIHTLFGIGYSVRLDRYFRRF